MSVSGAAAAAIDRSAEMADMTRAVLVAKKQQNVEKAEGEALVDLIKQSTGGVGQLINVHA